MLPYIGAQAGKRKPGLIGTQQAVKQWAQIKKELEGRAKLSALKIMTPVMSDFNKISKLKQIPEFYCQYLLLFLERLNDQQAGQTLSAEIRQIINHRSYYHKISDTLDQRVSILKAVESRLEIAEGFQDMNVGKSIKSSVKSKINDMLKQATSLQDIKTLQKQSICDLASQIIRLRANSMQIVGYVKMWRQKLTSISDKRIKFKIVFPTNGFNCVLLPLFDQSFIFNSFLGREMNMKQANNPFLIFNKQNRKKSEFQSIFKAQMLKDYINYDIKTSEILSQLSGKQDISIGDKQLDDKKKQKQQLKAKWENQIKYRSSQQPKQNEKDKLPKKMSVNSIVNNKNVLDIQAILLKHKSKSKNKLNNSKHQQSINKDNADDNPVSSPKTKKNQKILGVYGKGENNKIQLILNEKAALQRQLKQANKKNKQFQKILKNIEPKEEKKGGKNNGLNSSQIEPHQSKVSINKSRADFHNKVEAVYKSQNRKMNRTDRKLEDSQVSVEDVINQKKSLQKQLKGQIKQKLKLEKIIKKSELNIDKQLENNKVQRQKLEERVKYLQSKLSNYNDSPQGNKETDSILQKSKVSVTSIYTNQMPIDRRVSPSLNLYESKLIEQKQQRKSLQKQMKDLAKQKGKLEQTIQKSHKMMLKEKQILDKKMQKYEQTINKLKQEQALEKSTKNSETMPARKKSESLRMYTASALKQEEAKRQKKQNSHAQSANYFKLPPQIKRVNTKPKIISQMDEQQEKHEKNVVISKSINKVQIIQTKKTIEIVYKRSSKSKSKNDQTQKAKDNTDETENKNVLSQMVKEKNSLLFQLEREEAKRQQQMKAKIRKAQRDGDQIAKYKQAIEKQRNKKYQLENKIKRLHKELYDEFEQKMKAQKMKFYQQKKELIANIQNQKNEKQLREKYLNNQIKFLKQMESNEKQLMQLLEMEKKGRLEKQRELQMEIAKKEELLQIIELEQIKKGLESQIRKEIQKGTPEQQEEQIDIEQQKDQLRIQIEQLHNQKQEELEQIDEQNQKLKSLISRIKAQEGKLISAIKENIKEDVDHQQDGIATEQQQVPNLAMTSTELRPQRLKLERDYHSDAEQSKLKQSKLSKKTVENQKEGLLKQDEFDIQQTERVFQSRLRYQEQHQANMKSEFKKIRQSSEYHEKEEVQNLIEMYLQNPHQYPPSKTRDYSPEEKTDIKQEVLKKSRLAGQFEHELLQLKEMQKFVPTADDDIMTSHLLSLKRVYQQKQSSALKQELFPAIVQNESANQRQLSFESDQTPPPVTINEHVKQHAKKYPIKKNDGKNFLAINRMRLAIQEEDRKQKEKHLIQQEAKRRAREQILKKQLRARQQQRYQKSLQKKKALHQEQSQKNSRVHQKANELLQKKQSLKSNEQIEQKKKSSLVSLQGTIKTETYKQQLQNIEDRQQQDTQHQQHQHEEQEDKQKQASQKEQKNEQQNIDEEDKQDQKQGDFGSNYLEITNQHSSLDRQRKQLQEDVHQYQDQIRSYVSKEEKYDIYQQFVESSNVDSYIKNIYSISSDEVRGLNSNNTIFKDIPTYKSIVILIAKDRTKEVEVGIGVFHKEYHESLYICDYVVAHNMRNFLNLVFNFSRYVFKLDSFTNKIEYYFNLNKLEDEISLIHFIEFEQKCKRMGEVYVKVGADKTRKYALRRNLFEPADKEFQKESQGIQMHVSLQIHGDHLRQQGYGFQNKRAIEYFSSTVLLGMYMKRNQQALEVFRKNAEEDLKYRELLITALMFQKKEVELKNCDTHELAVQQRLQISKKLMDKFVIEDPTHIVQDMQLTVCNTLSQKTKRCTFNIDQEEINYIIHFPEEALTKIQSSNSSEVGYFLNLVPKYKVLVVEANEFLSMNKANPQVNTFFYVKHFIKNVVEVTKQEYHKVFVPEVQIKSEVFLKDFSDQIKQAVFARQNIKIGWNNAFSNSIIFNPSHKDLVIKKPYIISLLSATVERAIQGTPLVATLVQ